jgi:hypothetical protein
MIFSSEIKLFTSILSFAVYIGAGFSLYFTEEFGCEIILLFANATNAKVDTDKVETTLIRIILFIFVTLHIILLNRNLTFPRFAGRVCLVQAT